MKNSCSPRVFLPILLLLALALSACQFSSSAPSKAPAPKPATPTGPHIALALPSSGPYAGVSAKIRNGAEIALRELQAGGLLAQLHMVDTSKPDWNAQLAALPPNCIMVGGPLQAPVFKQLQTSGMLEKRVFFAFMPSLLPGDEGVRAWRFFPSPQDQIDRLVSFVTEDLGLRTFGAFYPTDNYGPRMTGLLDQKLTGMGITLHSASYTPGQSSTWSGQAATLINPTTQENITAPIPQTQFEALFLPDSWKNMNLLTTSLMYNGEDRLVLLGTTLWEQGLDGKTVAVLVRGDREVNDIKLKNLLNATTVELAPAAVVEKVTAAPLGFAGPVGLDVPIYADLELQGATDYVVGANAADAHLVHVDLRRDVKVTAYADLRCITLSDPCPRCGGAIELPKGIEVGHIFKLGTKYSDAMHAVYLDENGKENVMIMGCYGIGISRVVASAIEQNHDEHGIIFPPTVAPVECILLNLDPGKEEVRAKAEEIYAMLCKAGVTVLLDDREERPGVKFKDADLIGAPMQLVLGGKGLSRGVLECKDRRTGEKGELPVDALETALPQWMEGVRKAWAERRA